MMKQILYSVTRRPGSFLRLKVHKYVTGLQNIGTESVLRDDLVLAFYFLYVNSEAQKLELRYIQTITYMPKLGTQILLGISSLMCSLLHYEAPSQGKRILDVQTSRHIQSLRDTINLRLWYKMIVKLIHIALSGNNFMHHVSRNSTKPGYKAVKYNALQEASKFLGTSV